MVSEDVLKTVRSLTENDPKTLSQKCTKLFEEGGELASAILSYENASGNLHKVSNRYGVADECADIILVALSIAYELGFTDDEIATVIKKKTDNWANRQAIELAINPSKIPHEIHVTVQEVPDLEKFKIDCAGIKVKPILLDLHSKADVIKDMMTSQVVIGSSTDAFTEMDKTILALNSLGYKTIRGKIETAPWHPITSGDNSKILSNYFESHVEVYIKNDDETFNRLKEICRNNGCHASNNAFKIHGDIKTIMVTIRERFISTEDFKKSVSDTIEILKKAGFAVTDKPIIEYSIYDSNHMHDAEWLQ